MFPYSNIESKQSLSGKFNNQNIVLSGKRDIEIIELIEKEGGSIKSTVNKNTNLLVVDSLDLQTSKMKKAKELNIKIILTSELKNQYL